jgi:NADPH:quinone reductase
MSSRDEYAPGAASGAEVRKDGEKWTSFSSATCPILLQRFGRRSRTPSISVNGLRSILTGTSVPLAPQSSRQWERGSDMREPRTIALLQQPECIRRLAGQDRLVGLKRRQLRAVLRARRKGDVLAIREIPEPEPKDGHAVIEVKAFGLNHAELHMRKGEWAEIADVSGIECVGVVKSCPGGEFAPRAKVAALMGGLGRTINGSYAEYTRAPVTNVAAIESGLSWADLAVIPETYATAWTCLFRNLEIASSQTPVIRGATSSFGQAALNMAVNAGAKVIGTTRSRDQFPMVEALGAVRAEVEGQDLSKRIAEAGKIDAVLDLVGNSTILDSLAMLRRGGLACLAGWLGGLAPIADFNPLLQMASGVYLTFFGSFVLGKPGFPLSDVPLQAIAADVEAGRYRARPTRVFRFEDIQPPPPDIGPNGRARRTPELVPEPGERSHSSLTPNPKP